MKFHSINCCLSTRIKLNTNTIFFKIPMKINKNNAYAYYKKYAKYYNVYCARPACFCIK